MGRMRIPDVVATSWAGRRVRTPLTSGSSPPAAIATPAVRMAATTVMARAARLRRSSMAPLLGDMKLALLAGGDRKRRLPYRIPDSGLVVSVHVHVDPDQPVVGGREREDADQPEQRISRQRPEHPAVEDPEVLARQHVVDPQVPRPGHVDEVGRVEGRVPSVGQVGAPLQRRLLGTPWAGRVREVLTRGFSRSCWAAPATLSPSKGSAFWSPMITNRAPGLSPPR